MEVVICPEDLGLNPKISTLRQLVARARYDLLVIADGDVKVGPDYLAQVAAALRQPGVGLVSCPYRAGASRTLGAKLEALTIAGGFYPVGGRGPLRGGHSFRPGGRHGPDRGRPCRHRRPGPPGRFPGGRLSVGLPRRRSRASG